MILPVAAVVGFMLGLFANNERRASRIRELAADQASLEVAPLGAFGPALVKSAIFSPLWAHCLAEDANRLEAGLETRNLSLAFANMVRYDLDREKISESMGEMLQSRLAHPTDSHPPIAQRLMAAYREVPRYGSDVLFRVESAKSSAWGDFDAIERELTSLQHSFLARTGASASPQEKIFSDEEKRRLEVANATYILGATIINADGRQTLAQFAIAERMGQELIQGFNRIDFREYCHYYDDLSDAAAAAKTLADVLRPEDHRLVISWLRDIAHAEPPPSQRSMDWLSYVERTLGQGLNT